MFWLLINLRFKIKSFQMITLYEVWTVYIFWNEGNDTIKLSGGIVLKKKTFTFWNCLSTNVTIMLAFIFTIIPESLFPCQTELYVEQFDSVHHRPKRSRIVQIKII